MFNKSKFKFVIDALMLFSMVAIAGIGFLMKFVLIPGKERWAKYGRNVDLSLFGMDRHEWGTIHLTLAFILLGLLMLHIILNWKMILSMYCGLIDSKRARRIIAAIFIFTGVILISFPFFVKPEVSEVEQGEGRQRTEHSNEETIEQPEKSMQDNSSEAHRYTESSIEVKGNMMLKEDRPYIPYKKMMRKRSASFSNS